MTNPAVNAFFVGRALAEAINEQIENSLTNTLSDIGKFDAEQRERLRQFTQQVVSQAAVELETAMGSRNATNTTTVASNTDLQVTIDELRAEIAHLRAQLQRYRQRSLS